MNTWIWRSIVNNSPTSSCSGMVWVNHNLPGCHALSAFRGRPLGYSKLILCFPLHCLVFTGMFWPDFWENNLEIWKREETINESIKKSLFLFPIKFVVHDSFFLSFFSWLPGMFCSVEIMPNKELTWNGLNHLVGGRAWSKSEKKLFGAMYNAGHFDFWIYFTRVQEHVYKKGSERLPKKCQSAWC